MRSEDNALKVLQNSTNYKSADSFDEELSFFILSIFAFTFTIFPQSHRHQLYINTGNFQGIPN